MAASYSRSSRSSHRAQLDAHASKIVYSAGPSHRSIHSQALRAKKADVKISYMRVNTFELDVLGLPAAIALTRGYRSYEDEEEESEEEEPEEDEEQGEAEEIHWRSSTTSEGNGIVQNPC